MMYKGIPIFWDEEHDGYRARIPYIGFRYFNTLEKAHEYVDTVWLRTKGSES